MLRVPLLSCSSRDVRRAVRIRRVPCVQRVFLMMTDEQIDLVTVVMEMIGGTIDNYDEDPYHAPARWVLNNWWHTLNAVLALQVGDQSQSSSDSLEATDHSKREK